MAKFVQTKWVQKQMICFHEITTLNVGMNVQIYSDAETKDMRPALAALDSGLLAYMSGLNVADP